MARPLRIEYEEAVYHVTTRGNGGEPVFRDDEDRENILATIKKEGWGQIFIVHNAPGLTDQHF